MNERIRLLAEKAGITEYPAKLSVCKEDDGTISTKYEYPLEKFAELIVRECYEECKGNMVPKGMAEEHDLNYNDGVMDCAIGLLQHFGVES